MIKFAALALFAALAGASNAVVQLLSDPPMPVRLLAVLRAKESASSSSSSSVAIVITLSVLLAQAQCVAALDTEVLRFAEFGVFRDADAPCDGRRANDVVVGSLSSHDDDAFVGDTSEWSVPWTGGDALKDKASIRLLAASTTTASSSRAVDSDNGSMSWADDGFGSDMSDDLPPPPPPADPSDLLPVEYQRVAIRAIKFHPIFAAPRRDAPVMNFVEHDFAVIELEHDLVGAKSAQLVDNTVEAVQEDLIPERIGVLHVDDVAIDAGEACCFDATSPRAEDAVCATSPRMPWTAHDVPTSANSTHVSTGNSNSSVSTADATSGPRAQSKIWSFLFYTRMQRRSGVAFFGFAARSAPAAVAHTYTWPASGFDFISRTTDDAGVSVRWVAEAEDVKMVVPVGEVGWLPLHLSFVAGLRAQKAGTNFCDGSLVGSSFVLTAAHCIDGSNKLAFVSIGSLDASDVADGEQIAVVRVIKHPQYDSLRRANDFALLELAAPSMYPRVPIFDNPQTPPRTGTIFGYGAMATISDEDVPSDELRSLALDIIARTTECEQLLQQPIEPSMFCAGGAPS